MAWAGHLLRNSFQTVLYAFANLNKHHKDKNDILFKQIHTANAVLIDLLAEENLPDSVDAIITTGSNLSDLVVSIDRNKEGKKDKANFEAALEKINKELTNFRSLAKNEIELKKALKKQTEKAKQKQNLEIKPDETNNNNSNTDELTKIRLENKPQGTYAISKLLTKEQMHALNDELLIIPEEEMTLASLLGSALFHHPRIMMGSLASTLFALGGLGFTKLNEALTNEEILQSIADALNIDKEYVIPGAVAVAGATTVVSVIGKTAISKFCMFSATASQPNDMKGKKKITPDYQQLKDANSEVRIPINGGGEEKEPLLENPEPDHRPSRKCC